MFFTIHDERKIGYKCLTDADLGRSHTSHQTHIGLFDDVLTFLPNSAEIDDAMLIYKNKCAIIPVLFDRIKNPNGTYRSPKIRTGTGNVLSIVSMIRTEASSASNLHWYLFWFGLSSEQIVFLLFNEASDTFKDIRRMGIDIHPGVKNRVTPSDLAFKSLFGYLENIVNQSGTDLLKELEIVSQTGVSSVSRKFRAYDIKRANQLFEKIGRTGEEEVNAYLERQVEINQIETFNWYNKEKESGYPYDFSIEEKNGNIIYLDVKTTNYNFEQQIIFSNQEISFISETPNNYQLYRVYKETGNSYLRICDNCKPYANMLNQDFNSYRQKLKELEAEVKSIKIAIFPNIKQLTFSESIEL